MLEKSGMDKISPSSNVLIVVIVVVSFKILWYLIVVIIKAVHYCWMQVKWESKQGIINDSSVVQNNRIWREVDTYLSSWSTSDKAEYYRACFSIKNYVKLFRTYNIHLYLPADSRCILNSIKNVLSKC